MNFQSWPLLSPLRIMMINPLVHASRLTILKFLSGQVFGMNRLIDLILLVYSNEIPEANELIQEIVACNFGCLNTIVATSDLPSLSDADIFACMTNFANPNLLDFDNLDTDDQFDTFYLYIKVALSLAKSATKTIDQDDKLSKDKSKIEEKPKPKPIFIGDGIIVLDILNTMGPGDKAAGYFCAGCLPALARSTIAEYLKVRCTDINTVYVWGSNYEEFHVEVEKPFIKSDIISEKGHCDWEMVSNDVLKPLKIDRLQFNASWMKKEFVQKLTDMARKNPCGPIYRAWKMNRFIYRAWSARLTGEKVYISAGVISDGSLRTIKGLAYILPVIFYPDGRWEINHRFEDTPHLIQEIKRFNKITRQHHDKLMKYCRKFLEDNIINQGFVPAEEETESFYSEDVDPSVHS